MYSLVANSAKTWMWNDQKLCSECTLFDGETRKCDSFSNISPGTKEKGMRTVYSRHAIGFLLVSQYEEVYTVLLRSQNMQHDKKS